VSRWGVLAITGMEVTPTSSPGGATASFEEMPVLTGGTPDATAKPWCVAIEPIESGKVGRVAVGGVVQLKAEDLGKAAGAQVLWKDSEWALIRIEYGIVRGRFTGAWAIGTTATVTDLVNTGTTYSGVKNYLSTFTGTETLACEIAYVGAEWVLVSAQAYEQEVVTDITVGSDSIVFKKETLYVVGKKTPSPASVTISTTNCT